MQTIAANYWPRPVSAVPFERRLVRTEPEVQVLVYSQTPVNPRGHVVLVHGLEGSAESGYMCSLAAALVDRGFAAHRFNLRTCGGTQHLCPTLYHAGLTSDLHAFLRELDGPAFLVGYSLGGNVALKLAGELADGAPALVRGVATVSTPLDLGVCAARISDPDNRIYEARFVRRMRARLSATGRYADKDFAGLRTVMQIDDRITAPSFGFRDAAHYYATQSAIGYLPQIRVPVLLIQSKDDTFIPFRVYESPELRSNPALQLLATDHGGHVGFLSRGPHRFWVDRTIAAWLERGTDLLVCQSERSSPAGFVL